MKYAFLLITLFTYSMCIGQSSGNAPALVPNFNSGLISSQNRYNSIHNKGFLSYDEVMQEYENIEGSPYLYGGEIVVDLISIMDSVIKDIPIKYDVYNNEIIARKEDESITVLDQKYYKGFIYKNSGQIELYLKFKANDCTFYRVLFRTDNFFFYKSHEIRIEKNSHYVPGLEFIPQKFVKRQEYFVMNNNVEKPVKLRNGKAISYFPKEYAAQVAMLKKELNIKKLRKEEDYIKIFKALDNPGIKYTLGRWKTKADVKTAASTMP